MTGSDDQAEKARRIIAYARERLADLAEVRARMEHPDTPTEDREEYARMVDLFERAIEDPYVFATEVVVGPDGKVIVRL